MKFSFQRLAAIAAGVLAAGSLQAGVINPVGVTGHDGGNWPSSLGHLTDMLNGNNVGFLTGDHDPGMTINDPDDPSTWTYSGSSWPQEWKANSRLDPNTTLNAKIGWAVIDLGSVVTDLETMYLWNVRHQSDTENTDTYNVYYSSGVGIDALPAMPNSKSTTGDYDFSSGDWTQIGSTNTLSQNPSNNNTPQGSVALGGVSARYLAIEILTAGDATKSRVGLAQVEITQVPEPGSLALFGLGGLLIARRRRA